VTTPGAGGSGGQRRALGGDIREGEGTTAGGRTERRWGFGEGSLGGFSWFFCFPHYNASSQLSLAEVGTGQAYNKCPVGKGAPSQKAEATSCLLRGDIAMLWADGTGVGAARVGLKEARVRVTPLNTALPSSPPAPLPPPLPLLKPEHRAWGNPKPVFPLNLGSAATSSDFSRYK